VTTSGTPREWCQWEEKSCCVRVSWWILGTGRKVRVSSTAGAGSAEIGVGYGGGRFDEMASGVVYASTRVSRELISPGAARVVKTMVSREWYLRLEQVTIRMGP